MSLLVQNNLISPPNRFSICDKISLKFIGYIDCDRKIPRHSWKSDYEVYAPFQTKILERYIHWKSTTVWMNEPFTPEKDRCVWQGAFLSRLSPWHKFFNALTILLLGFSKKCVVSLQGISRNLQETTLLTHATEDGMRAKTWISLWDMNEYFWSLLLNYTN